MTVSEEQMAVWLRLRIVAPVQSKLETGNAVQATPFKQRRSSNTGQATRVKQYGSGNTGQGHDRCPYE